MLDRGRQHATSTAALCMCTFTQAYLLISVFPYAGFMVVDLVPNHTVENAGTYAGFLASSFMTGRAFSSYHWGTLADMYGRKFALCASLIMSTIFSLMFGLSRSFRCAIFWRFLLGFGNSLVSTAKTAVTELAFGNEQLERRAMGLVIGMRGWGLLIGPGLSGYLAEPLKQYPDNQWLQNSGVWRDILAKYPFLLPNLVAVLLCLICFVTVICFVEETLPDDERRSIKLIPHDIFCSMFRPINLGCPEEAQQVENGESSALLVKGSSTETISSLIMEPSQPSRQPTIWSRGETRRHVWLYAVFSFIVSAVDDAFPLFCMSHNGGLSLSEAKIGKVLSSAGLVFASFQYTVFAIIIDQFGMHSALKIGSILGNTIVFLIPLSLILNRNAKFDGDLTFPAYIFLTIVMGTCKVFTCLFFASLAISANKTVPRSQRARMNGLNMVSGSIGKALGPTFAGLLISFCLSSGFIQPVHGTVLVFFTISALGAVAVIQTWMLYEVEEQKQTMP